MNKEYSNVLIKLIEKTHCVLDLIRFEVKQLKIHTNNGVLIVLRKNVLIYQKATAAAKLVFVLKNYAKPAFLQSTESKRNFAFSNNFSNKKRYVNPPSLIEISII